MTRPATQPPLRVRGAHKRFGRVLALDGVDMHVERGEALGLLGPNGAGKSTLVKAACGLVRLQDGEIRIGDAAAGSREARAQIGYLAELFRFPPWLTVDEVLRFHQRLARSSGGAAERGQLLARVELSHASDRRVAGLSKGMQQRLGIAQAILGSPPLVVLDEPTSALDPGGRAMVRELVGDLRRDGHAVLLSSHLLAEVEACCTRVLILDHGTVLLDRPIGELVADEDVVVRTSAGERRISGVGRSGVPALVRELVAAGEDLYEVRVDQATLEATYLELINRVATTGGAA